jgi:dTDP-4-dehydrorhamnose 3,5-epimerase
MGAAVTTDILLTPLRRIDGPLGGVLHALKASAPGFSGFAEAYFSEIHQGAIKGWRRHNRVTLNLIVPRGDVLFVLHNDRTGDFAEHCIGESNYSRLTIPPGFWVAFRGEGLGTSLILDIIDEEHETAESETCPLTSFAYLW